MADRCDAFRGLSVLVVEDEFLVADELGRELESHGARVVGPVATVADALAAVADEAPLDAAVLDVNLGGTPVFPVADALVARGVPFVFLTGYDRWALPSDYAGIASCEKPANLPDVAKALFG